MAVQAKGIENRGLLIIGAGVPLLTTAFQVAQLVASLLTPASGTVRHRRLSKSSITARRAPC